MSPKLLLKGNRKVQEAFQVPLGSAVWYWRGSIARWVQLVPSFDPCDHGICQLEEVGVHLPELGFYLFGEFNVAILDSGAVLRKGCGLEERNELLLPVDAIIFLLEVHKWVACLAVPDVRQTRLDAPSQMITDHLKLTRIRCQQFQCLGVTDYILLPGWNLENK